jgi:hypothetical protein
VLSSRGNTAACAPTAARRAASVLVVSCMMTKERWTIVTGEGLHRLRVLHCDAELRNILWDWEKVVIVDFERAESRDGKPLGILNINGQDTKGIKHKREDEFDVELRSLLGIDSLRMGR